MDPDMSSDEAAQAFDAAFKPANFNGTVENGAGSVSTHPSSPGFGDDVAIPNGNESPIIMDYSLSPHSTPTSSDYESESDDETDDDMSVDGQSEQVSHPANGALSTHVETDGDVDGDDDDEMDVFEPLPTKSKGIYRGLPIYDESVKGLTAIVTGATGISGWYMVKTLAESPKRWTKIYCVSRSPPTAGMKLPKNAVHVPCDLTQDKEDIAAIFKEHDIKADYCFFYAYVQPAPKPGEDAWADGGALCFYNALILQSFLEALTIASIHPQRVVLQTGAKYYGYDSQPLVSKRYEQCPHTQNLMSRIMPQLKPILASMHLGPTKLPHAEDEPRVPHDPNFYYEQEDILAGWCDWMQDKGHAITYAISMPSYVMGAVPNNVLNAFFPLAVYASICAELNEPMAFPGGETAWNCRLELSSSKLDAYMVEWMALSPELAGIEGNGERFNTANGDVWTWSIAWPMIAWWFGVEWTGPSKDAPDTPGEYHTFLSPVDPPPSGGAPAKIHYKYTTSNWARQPHVRAAWANLVAKHNLTTSSDVDHVFGHFMQIGEHTFGILDVWTTQSWPLIFSYEKCRAYGWEGSVDSMQNLLEVLEEMVGMGMIPRFSSAGPCHVDGAGDGVFGADDDDTEM